MLLQELVEVAAPSPPRLPYAWAGTLVVKGAMEAMPDAAPPPLLPPAFAAIVSVPAPPPPLASTMLEPAWVMALSPPVIPAAAAPAVGATPPAPTVTV